MCGCRSSSRAGERVGKTRTIRKWTPEEDARVRLLVEEHGTKQWGLIGQKLQGRTGKQCRER